jgi:hypothetical protein
MKTCYVVHEVGLQMKQSVKGEKIISCNGLYEGRKKTCNGWHEGEPQMRHIVGNKSVYSRRS